MTTINGRRMQAIVDGETVEGVVSGWNLNSDWVHLTTDDGEKYLVNVREIELARDNQAAQSSRVSSGPAAGEQEHPNV